MKRDNVIAAPQDSNGAGMKDVLIPIGLACAGFGVYSLCDAATKLLSSGYHVTQIMFLTATFSLFFASMLGLAGGGKAAFRTQHLDRHLLRGIFGVMIGTLNIMALARLQLAEFYVLVFTAPFWVTLLSALILKDEVGWRRMSAILVGFCAVLFMLRPGTGLFGLGSLAVLGGAVLFAFNMLLARTMGPTEPKPMFAVMLSAVTVMVMAPFQLKHFVMPETTDWLIFFGIGAGGAIGSICVAVAFISAPATSIVAPFHYTQMVWGVLLGYVMFGDMPDANVVIGATVLTASGVYMILREARLYRRPKMPVEDALETGPAALPPMEHDLAAEECPQGG